MYALPNLIPVLPEIVLAVSGMALLLLGAFRGDRSASEVSWIAVLALVVAGVVLTVVQHGRAVSFGGQFVLDGFAHFMKWLVLIGSALAVVMSRAFNQRESMARPEYPVLILFATLGMLMMC